MQSKNSLLAYSPMLHSRLFTETANYRSQYFPATRQPLSLPSDPSYHKERSPSDYFLDGNPSFDRPLVVQFCANNPDTLFTAAQYVQPFCDAVDLNLGCPQGIAKSGKYGAFLQEDWDLVYRLINKLHRELDVPVTAKIRVLETKEKTLEYARVVISAGASILAVHGRQRDQKGHNTGLADWRVIRFLRQNLPPEVVLFANGNILQHEDIARCMDFTGVDGVMSAEGNLYDPTIFAEPPLPGQESAEEYWRGQDGKGGYRVDAVMRRYLDIVYKYILQSDPPKREPLFVLSSTAKEEFNAETLKDDILEEEPQAKRQKRVKNDHRLPPSLKAMQAHLFNLLRSLVAKHTDIRDALAKCRAGDMAAYERVLTMVERATRKGIMQQAKVEEEANSLEGKATAADSEQTSTSQPGPAAMQEQVSHDDRNSSLAAIERCKRPWWVCQAFIRPLPEEALKKGAMTLSKKERAKLAAADTEKLAPGIDLPPELEVRQEGNEGKTERSAEVPSEGLVCG